MHTFSQPRSPLVLALVLAVLGCGSAQANDSSFGDDNGTIRLLHQPDISMDKEALLLSEERVQVDYVFTNNSERALTVPIAFPMPPMYFGMADHSELTDFKLWVDGKPIATTRKLVVLLDDGSDISKAFAASGWSADDVATFTESGTVPKGRKPLPARWIDPDQQPRFTLSEYFVWQQLFPARRSVQIRHAYAPSVSTGVPQSSAFLLESYAKDTCIDPATRTSMQRRVGEHGLGWANLRYVLTTGKNWNGPIKDFQLTIRKQAASDMLSLCFDGALEKIDPLTFQFKQTNFVPMRDLNLLFVRRPE
ncbi:DUF4424 domain-containing protein [Xanthomonas hortorum]|uniref:DUF4424 domain-containing protein n=1 Tax=Xanthomonas hortorum pv. hederae TaxID=453603 RepID=A0A9X4H4D8_9XANT|nr:DUF4424 domain-containing protein [Xanthomonas hortorum]MCE4372288.1 DUF4424 domain-containing protein [Xanthomonas hortorum pv. hederae]MDC8639355.1 DUF4424 domain-containing protein [Xanthomonas hortorum pv. hederae]PPU79428.1 hypothetical protein XhhCFBP4925_14570 [Xanthomonas hortorum pv. hederae]PUE99118.1 DUF4424 domain-containing protein [Xanthomonas hortorum pv. hederae]